MSRRSEVAALIESGCAERELEWESTGEASYAVTLPGTHKLKTICNLIVGEHALRIEAFVMRQPDERREELWAWLLQRNARMYGVAFSIDAVGDVYLTGRVNLAGLDEDELDRLLGAVLTYADESFDSMLEIGFGTAIRREWEWRVKRGESTANLAAFAHLFAPSTSSGPATGGSDPS
ncbi:YbjN domain-containing protein [Micromonospora sp. DR5-3]|uniref:YbjN domain-containing protein n=1 Tax=unclassified Micromonospora TaxID=2617518 RepID=UPI0011D93AC8|nr:MULTISPECIES: YbjN domain-containing protein [unclassified Micromonospora]MCW3812940.1 YbjN domain-containing protein [Micromonospora sp. DR5-3]TYC26060.1 YbjN domain-containing protein [Micromonospora sp. MP36]